MIVFYTRYDVAETLDIKALLELSFKCVTGMKNAPDTFKNMSWDGSESGEWKSGRNLIAYEIDEELDLVAFRVSIVDDNDELWTEDIALNCVTHEIQLRLAREKKIISAEYNRSFNLPYLFKKIIRDGMGGMDKDIPVGDKPLYIDENNIEIVKRIINGDREYSLPVIYVSCLFGKEDYEVDVEELAKDMAGSAHVLVERTSKISQILRVMTNSKNAYNGAVDIFYNDDSFRYLKRLGITSNQYRYKISHAIYDRMAMRNIDEKSSLSTIRLKNKTKKLKNDSLKACELEFKVEALEEKCKENQELFEYASEELKKHEKKINELENANYESNSKVESLKIALNEKNGSDNHSITFKYTENELYEDEIKRFVIKCIKATLTTCGNAEKQRRDYHVLMDIVNNNTYSETGDSVKAKIMEIFKRGKLSRTDVESLRKIGFKEKPGDHNKYILNGDERYIITVSNSPSDYREGENLAHDASNLIFGRY